MPKPLLNTAFTTMEIIHASWRTRALLFVIWSAGITTGSAFFVAVLHICNHLVSAQLFLLLFAAVCTLKVCLVFFVSLLASLLLVAGDLDLSLTVAALLWALIRVLDMCLAVYCVCTWRTHGCMHTCDEHVDDVSLHTNIGCEKFLWEHTHYS